MLTDEGKIQLLNAISGLNIQEKGIFQIHHADDISYDVQKCINGEPKIVSVTHAVIPKKEKDPDHPTVHIKWQVPEPWHGDINYTWNLYDENNNKLLENGFIHVTPEWTENPCTAPDPGVRTYLLLDISTTP